VQAYISPPIAAVFLFGVFWPRANGKGAIAALLTGLFFGGLRLVTELIHSQHPIGFSPLAALAEINFLHFAVFLFILCSAVLVFVSRATAAPEISKLRDLTYRHTEKVAPTGTDISGRRWNVVFSIVLVVTVVVLWIVFF
jgi:SSS family solute:Na+ symporter